MITELDGSFHLVAGGAGYSTVGDQITGENTVQRIDPATGEATEIDDNPDGTDVNPNVSAIAAGPGGILHVVDAGGNTVYRVDPEMGDFELELTLPTLDGLLGGEETGAPTVDAAKPPRQLVPTGIASDADGQMTLSFLSQGGPAEGPSIVTVNDDGTMTPVANCLSAVVSIGYGPDGELYVVQLSDDFATFAPGAVVRIGAAGTAEPVVEVMLAPHGIAFSESGHVSVGTVALPLGSA